MAETPYQPTDRRPIASRNRKTSQAIAHWLVQRGVSANAISVAGMIAGIAAGIALASTSLVMESPANVSERLLWLLAAGCVQLRLLANMFDGMVAIETGKASPVGELYNEVPDRVSDAATLIGAGYAVGGVEVLGYAATAVAILTAYMRAVGKVAGARQEFCGPMAKQHRMFVITMISLYCAIAPSAWQLNRENSEAWGLISIGLGTIIVGGFWTAMRRLMRIAATLREGTS